MPAIGTRFENIKLRVFQKDTPLKQIKIVTSVNVNYNNDKWFNFADSFLLKFQSITYKNRQ